MRQPHSACKLTGRKWSFSPSATLRTAHILLVSSQKLCGASTNLPVLALSFVGQWKANRGLGSEQPRQWMQCNNVKSRFGTTTSSSPPSHVSATHSRMPVSVGLPQRPAFRNWIHWRLHRILGVTRRDHVANTQIQNQTDQPPLSEIIQRRSPVFPGYISRMAPSAGHCSTPFRPTGEHQLVDLFEHGWQLSLAT